MLVRIQGTETAAAPPAYHLFHTESGAHVYVANGSRVYSVDSETAEALAGWPNEARLERLGLAADAYITDQPLASPPVRTLSLAVAQKCNLGCVYCYAQQGTFGDAPRDMDEAVAAQSVDLLLAEAAPGTSAEGRTAAAAQVTRAVKDSVGVSVDAQVADPGSLERSTGKMRRVIDRRAQT